MRLETVRRLWKFYEERRWDEAARLFASDAVMIWHTSGERFGGAAIIEVNRLYPEGWRIEMIETAKLDDGRVLSVVRVSHPPNVFFATSLFDFDADKIKKIDEYWATFEKPSDWRKPGFLENYEYYG